MRRLIFVSGVCALLFAGLGLTSCSDKQAAERVATTVEPAKTVAPPTSTPTAAPERQWAFRGQRGITAVFVPTDLALYRSLLPAAFDMPEAPLAAVAAVYYYDVTLPLTPYHEGYVVLQCRYQGRTGWYVLTMPVDDDVANAGGRSLGFPKYIADQIDLNESDGVWSGHVAYQGRDIMRVTFTPQPGTKPVETSSSDAGLPVFLLVPPAEGPQVNEVDIELSGAQRKVTTAGSATIEADPGEAWAALLPPGGVAASATLDEVTGEWVLSGTP
ncbi:MAG: acetoacetate decarboxylase family protein [Dehalococcoidia bacterium]|jgi:acetoacetate decarboxylase|nr:acetoacetate decarboxylase family protein [Dehalococcoidia bacterium]